MGAVQRARPVQAVGVPDGLRDLDLALLRDLLADERHREERREVGGTDRLERGRVEVRGRRDRQVRRDVVPGPRDPALIEHELRLTGIRGRHPRPPVAPAAGTPCGREGEPSARGRRGRNRSGRTTYAVPVANRGRTRKIPLLEPFPVCPCPCTACAGRQSCYARVGARPPSGMAAVPWPRPRGSASTRSASGWAWVSASAWGAASAARSGSVSWRDRAPASDRRSALRSAPSARRVGGAAGPCPTGAGRCDAAGDDVGGWRRARRRRDGIGDRSDGWPEPPRRARAPGWASRRSSSQASAS